MEITLYTPREAAAYLGIPKHTLNYLRHTGRIQGIRKGNMTLYTEAQLVAADRRRYKKGGLKAALRHQAARKTA